jgi:hypothetical protein
LDENQTPQAEAAGEAAPAAAASTEQQQRTPEQVEAEWQAKQTALGRAHAAETQVLRDQVKALQAAQTPATGDGSASEAELKRQLAEAQKTLQQREQEYTAGLRAAKYPHAAEALDPTALAAMDEAKLAGLNERLAPQQSRPFGVDPSTPPREVGEKPFEEKSLAELKADLVKYSPQFAAEIAADRS